MRRTSGGREPDETDEIITDTYLKENHGKFVLEGSRSGANAAAVYITHALLPLDANGFGRIVRRTLEGTQLFLRSLKSLEQNLREIAHVVLPVVPYN